MAHQFSVDRQNDISANPHPNSKKDKTKRLNSFIDLFAGVGGFHIASKRAGLKCVFASEIDECAREVYQKTLGLYRMAI